MIHFTALIAPHAKGRPRFTRKGHAFTPAETRKWERDFRLLASAHKPRTPLTGPLEVALIFHVAKPKRTRPECKLHPAMRPDCDNFLKAALDSLCDFWRDDAQVVAIHARKAYAPAGVEPTVQVCIGTPDEMREVEVRA